MARLLHSKLLLMLVTVWLSLSLLASCCDAFHRPEGHIHTFATGDDVFVKVNSLTSIYSGLPISYYSLPFCTPQGGIRLWGKNLGELLRGDQVANSPYRFKVNVNESVYLCTTDPLGKDQVRDLKQRFENRYQVNMDLDNLPVMGFTSQGGIGNWWTGFPVANEGYPYKGETCINNHLKFRVLLHEQEGGIVPGDLRLGRTEEAGQPKSSYYSIVGFRVISQSFKRDPDAMLKLEMYDAIEPATSLSGPKLSQCQALREGERVSFTYEVEFADSEISWHSRWDAYLKTEDKQIFWFSAMNSVITAVIAFMVFFWLLRKDLAKCEQLALPQDHYHQYVELPGWKLVLGDVFREPSCSKLLCVMVGTGAQIAATTIVTAVFAAFGFLSPVTRGLLLTVMIYVHVLFSIVGGYVSVRLWGTIKATLEDWMSVTCLVACLFPGITFLVMIAVNAMLANSKSTAAIPVPLYALLMLLWFSITVPLTMLGGFLGTKAEPIDFPVKTNSIPREIPTRMLSSWLLVFGSGMLPSGTLHIELIFILSRLLGGGVYYLFGYLLLSLLMFIIACVEASVGVTFLRLRAQDWRWWWKSFFASGTAAIYVFVVFINRFLSYLSTDNGTTSVMVYLGYFLIIAIAIMLSAGAIGFLSSLYFVYYICSLIKID